MLLKKPLTINLSIGRIIIKIVTAGCSKGEATKVKLTEI